MLSGGGAGRTGGGAWHVTIDSYHLRRNASPTLYFDTLRVCAECVSVVLSEW